MASNDTIEPTEDPQAVLAVTSSSPGYTAVIMIHIPTLVSACMVAIFVLYLVNHIAKLRRLDQDSRLDLEPGDSFDGEESLRENVRQEALEKLLPKACCNGSGEDVSLLSSEECVICLEDFRNGELCRGFPGCNHVFHLTCMYQWLKNNITCPLCRQSLLNTREGRRVFGVQHFSKI